MVEDVAFARFGAIGAATKRGVEIDDAGERNGATEVVLKGRLSTALHRLNPGHTAGVRSLSCAPSQAPLGKVELFLEVFTPPATATPRRAALPR